MESSAVIRCNICSWEKCQYRSLLSPKLKFDADCMFFLYSIKMFTTTGQFYKCDHKCINWLFAVRSFIKQNVFTAWAQPDDETQSYSSADLFSRWLLAVTRLGYFVISCCSWPAVILWENLGSVQNTARKLLCMNIQLVQYYTLFCI